MELILKLENEKSALRWQLAESRIWAFACGLVIGTFLTAVIVFFYGIMR